MCIKHDQNAPEVEINFNVIRISRVLHIMKYTNFNLQMVEYESNTKSERSKWNKRLLLNLRTYSMSLAVSYFLLSFFFPKEIM